MSTDEDQPEVPAAENIRLEPGSLAPSSSSSPPSPPSLSVSFPSSTALPIQAPPEQVDRADHDDNDTGLPQAPLAAFSTPVTSAVTSPSQRPDTVLILQQRNQLEGLSTDIDMKTYIRNRAVSSCGTRADPTPDDSASTPTSVPSDSESSTGPCSATEDDLAMPFHCILSINEIMVQGSLTVTAHQATFEGRVLEQEYHQGYLKKTGRINSKFNRYWFQLQDGMLKYWTDPEKSRYLRGNIPIGSIAEILPPTLLTGATHFDIRQRKHTSTARISFAADDPKSAADWHHAISRAKRAYDMGQDDVVITIPVRTIEKFQLFPFSDNTRELRIETVDDFGVEGSPLFGLDEHSFLFTDRAEEAEKALYNALANDADTASPSGDVSFSLDALNVTALSDRNEDRLSSRFRDLFGLPASEMLSWSCKVLLVSRQRVPLYGKLYVGLDNLCFAQEFIGRCRVQIPFSTIIESRLEGGAMTELVVSTSADDEERFRFFGRDLAEECDQHIRTAGSTAIPVPSPPGVSFEDLSTSVVSLPEPVVPEGMTIVCVTIGSRGDVQPYIALAKRLQQDGHSVEIATHAEFETWVRAHGIGFQPLVGNPAELMQLCVENNFFSPWFYMNAYSKFYGTMRDLLATTEAACRNADMIIESPSSMAGIHVAEALRVPYFRAFTMPWTRTRMFPHAFMIPPGTLSLGGFYNKLSYSTFNRTMWTAMGSQINKWRTTDLGIGPTTLARLRQSRVPFLYNFSPSVVDVPADYPATTHVTGYWFLDESTTRDWTPDQPLVEFIDKARRDGKKLVYVGFGSIVVPNPADVSAAVVEAVSQAGVRCILSKGWSGRLTSDKSQSDVDRAIEEAEDVFLISSAPHDWLFTQVDAAVHHGGCGTTGASLRAGLPTVIKPFFADQFFYGSRVQTLGVGVCISSLAAKELAGAFTAVTTDGDMIERARRLGELIRQEDGVETAVNYLYLDLDHARQLVEERANESDLGFGRSKMRGQSDDGTGSDEQSGNRSDLTDERSDERTDQGGYESDATTRATTTAGDATPRGRGGTPAPAGSEPIAVATSGRPGTPLSSTTTPLTKASAGTAIASSNSSTSLSSRWGFRQIVGFGSGGNSSSGKKTATTLELAGETSNGKSESPESITAVASDDEEWLVVQGSKKTSKGRGQAKGGGTLEKDESKDDGDIDE